METSDTRSVLATLTVAALLCLAVVTGEASAQAQISEAASASYNQATTLVSSGSFAEALAKLDEVIGMEPGFERAHFDRGYVKEQMGDFAGAAADYARAAELDPANTEYALSCGIAHYRAGNYAGSLEALNPAVAKDSTNVKLWLAKGRAEEKLGNYELASASVHTATELDPDNPDAFYELGSIEYERNKKSKSYDPAIAAYTKALEMAPDHANAHAATFKLGRIHYLLGQNEQAVTFYTKATTIKPDFAPGFVSLGDAHRKLKAYDAAIAAYRQAIELKAPAPYGMAYYNLARAYQEQDEIEAAIEAYQTSVTDPEFRYADKAQSAIASLQEYLDKKRKQGGVY